MQHRTERVTVETARHRITGTLTLARDGYRSRVSDVLNASERDFISLTDVVIEHLDGDGATEEHPFMAISRHHIVFVTPLATDGAPAPTLNGFAPPV